MTWGGSEGAPLNGVVRPGLRAGAALGRAWPGACIRPTEEPGQRASGGTDPGPFEGRRAGALAVVL